MEISGTTIGTILQSYRSPIWNHSSGKIEIKGGKLTSDSLYGVYNGESGNVTVSGGELEGNVDGIRNGITGTITVKGGTITGNSDGIHNVSNGEISIEGGTIIGTNGKGIKGYIGTVNISETTTTTNISGGSYGVSIDNGNVIINSGTISRNNLWSI